MGEFATQMCSKMTTACRGSGEQDQVLFRASNQHAASVAGQGSVLQSVLVLAQVTPPQVGDARGLENLRMHGTKGRRPFESQVF